MSYNASKQHVLFTARAAAILINAEADAAVLNVNQTLDGWVQVYIDFTVGSLTNAVFTPQINDGSGWYNVTDPGALTLTASAAKAFAVCCKGAKQFRIAVTSTGTVTNSSATVKYGWQDAGGATG